MERCKQNKKTRIETTQRPDPPLFIFTPHARIYLYKRTCRRRGQAVHRAGAQRTDARTGRGGDKALGAQTAPHARPRRMSRHATDDRVCPLLSRCCPRLVLGLSSACPAIVLGPMAHVAQADGAAGTDGAAALRRAIVAAIGRGVRARCAGVHWREPLCM